MIIYHITSKGIWEKAKQDAVYYHPTIAEVGFIHCSTKEQTVSTLNRKFKGVKDLLLLEINSEKIKAKIVYEDLNNRGEKHPHIYGGIPIKAIIKIYRLNPDNKGIFSFPVK